MQFQPSREQRALVAELESPLDAVLPLARLHKAAAESVEAWSTLDQLGLFSLAVAEVDGGVGLGAAEEALAAISLGRCLASPTVFATLGTVHARGGQGPRPGERVALGFMGEAVVAVDDPEARWLLVRAGSQSALYAWEAERQPIGEGPWLDTLVTVKELGIPVAKFDEAGLARLRLIEAAALAGLADGATAMAVRYAQIREQFGRAIGSFQAVKHHCANMATATRCALDLVTFAAVALDCRNGDAPQLVESAFVAAADAAIQNAGKNIQIHGGIGFSDEAHPHLFLKRAQLLMSVGGGIEPAIERLSRIGISAAT